MLPNSIEGVRGPAAVADEALRDRVEIIPLIDNRGVLLDVRAHLREENGNTVDDGVLALTRRVGTQQRTKQEVIRRRSGPEAEFEAVASRSGATNGTYRSQRFKVRELHPPIDTVGQPGPMTLPVGEGIGATQLACAVMSLTRAAGSLPIITVMEPRVIIPGPPGTQPGSMHGTDCDVAVAAGRPPISTVAHVLLTMVSGSAGCGSGVGTGAGGWIGAWQCGAVCRIISVWRAAIPMCSSDLRNIESIHGARVYANCSLR